MKVLYIGQYTKGTTSQMRAVTLRSILQSQTFKIIDTHVPFYNTHRLWRSFGFRYKSGPLIKNTNKYIVASLKEEAYDLIWVDKAVFITPKTTALLRSRTKKLIHFTPDPAFTFHQSKLFLKSLPYYDFLVTTKSYELDRYHKYTNKKRTLYVTQGFDNKFHKPSKVPFSEKKGFVFIGHYEKERETILEKLLKNHIQITLAGIKWHRFAKKHQNNPNLIYLGNGVYGKDYVTTLQNAKMAWGAISKWIPELHTTRTFEIPACGTALVTEQNHETQSFFNDDEAIFYTNENDLVEKITFFINNDRALKVLTQKGASRVVTSGYDYNAILKAILKTITD